MHTILHNLYEFGFYKFNFADITTSSSIDDAFYQSHFDNSLSILSDIQTTISNNVNTILGSGHSYLYNLHDHLHSTINTTHPSFISMLELQTHPLFIDIAKQYLLSNDANNVYIFNNFYAVNYNYGHSFNTRVQSQNWHRDPGSRKVLKCFIFFNDVDEYNGALEYIPKSHYSATNQILKKYDFNNCLSFYPFGTSSSSDINIDNDFNYYRTIIECKAGDIVFVDTSGFHRAGSLLKNQYRLYSHTVFYSQDMLNDMEKINCNDKYYLGYNYYNLFDPNINFKLLSSNKYKLFYKFSP